MATYLTGDTHGNFLRVDAFCRTMETTKSDTMVILGDAGFNYSLNDRDTRAKEYASAIPVKFFCIHGNHEARPQRIPMRKHFRTSSLPLTVRFTISTGTGVS